MISNMRNILRFTLLLFSSLILLHCSDEKLTDISDGWKLAYDDKAEYRLPEYDDASWPSVNLPAPLFKEEKKQAVWIRKSISIPKSESKKDLSLYLGKFIEVDQTYVNGYRIGATGQDSPTFRSAWNFDRAYYLPPEILRFDEKNVIAIRVFAELRPRARNHFFIGEQHDIEMYTFWRVFGARHLPMIGGFLTLTIGLLFFVQYVNDRKRFSLHFGIVSILWFVLSLSHFLPGFGMDYHWKDVLYYSLLAVEIAWIYFFLEDFFELVIKPIRLLILLVVAGAALLSITSSESSHLTSWRMTVIFLLGLLSQVLWGVLVIRALRSGNKEARPILVSYILFFGCVILDVLSNLRIINTPIIWINVGYPGLIGAFALILMNRVKAMSVSLEQTKAEVETKNQQLTEVLSKVRLTVEELSRIFGIIDRTSLSLQERMSQQGQHLEETSAAIEEVTAGLQTIAQHAKQQDANVTENNAYIVEHILSTERITTAARDAVTLSTHSVGLSETSKRRLQEIVLGMERIRQSSSSISEITKMINELAEQTNLLSLNASIEAARAGQYGLGFAIVAQEVGKLADRSIQEAKSIQKIVTSTVSDIEGELGIVRQASDSMADVEDAARKVGHAVEGILNLCLQQDAVSLKLTGNMAELAKGSHEISDSTEEHSLSMQEIIKAVDELSDIMNGVMSGAVGFMDLLETLTRQIKTLNETLK